ncbi:major capsid protein [Acetobacter orientalis]|uniref:Major capsid protein n=1 Tax=Acetobacter orientalis TaxID=146474 RepID=A0A2Z5ZI90_9PROT|nr:major capsid protein [Acetobacter orientalis]
MKSHDYIAKRNEARARLTALHKSISKAEAEGTDCSDLEKEFDETEKSVDDLDKKAKRAKAVEDIEAEKSKDADEAEDGEDDDVSASVSKSFGISKDVSNRSDPAKGIIRQMIYKTWAASPYAGPHGAHERAVKAWGSREAGLLKKDAMGVGDLSLQAPNYRGDMLIPLLNKNIVTDGVFRDVDLVDNNLIAPRVRQASTGGFNLEKGLIQETSIGTDTKVLQGAFYGSIITATAQALSYSTPTLEAIIEEEMTTRHKLTVETIGLNSDGSIAGVPTGLKGFTKATQQITYADFSAYIGKYDEQSSFAVIQLFANLVTQAKALMRNAGDTADKVLLIPELILGDLQSRMTITGNFVLAGLLDGTLLGVEVRSTGNLSTNELSLVSGTTNAEANVAPCYLVSKNAVWRGNGNFYEFKMFDAGNVGNFNLVQQAGKAWRLVDSIQFALTNDISVQRLEIAGLVKPMDNSATAYVQPESGEISVATGNGKKSS